MSFKDDAAANVKGYVKGMAKFLTPENPETGKPISLTAEGIDTTPKKAPGVEHAQSLARSNNDTTTAASTVGVHPVEAHFQPTGVRHQLGKGIPK